MFFVIAKLSKSFESAKFICTFYEKKLLQIKFGNVEENFIL